MTSMNRWMAAAVLGIALSAAGQDEAPVQTVNGFIVPQYDEENNLKSKLFGDYAEVLPDGIIRITQLKIDFYSGTNVEMTVTAPKCQYRQKEGVAESDGDVRIAREKMVVTGVGFVWNNTEEKCRIGSNVKVVLKGARKTMDIGVEQ